MQNTMQNKNDLSIIKDARPQVGIFEYIDDKLYAVTREVDYSKSANGVDDAGEYFHTDLVRNVISSCSKEAQEKYKKVSNNNGFLLFPRGRVCYDFSNDKYQIFGESSIIGNANVRQTIARKFSLPMNKVVFYKDPFYNLYTL